MDLGHSACSRLSLVVLIGISLPRPGHLSLPSRSRCRPDRAFGLTQRPLCVCLRLTGGQGREAGTDSRDHGTCGKRVLDPSESQDRQDQQLVMCKSQRREGDGAGEHSAPKSLNLNCTPPLDTETELLMQQALSEERRLLEEEERENRLAHENHAQLSARQERPHAGVLNISERTRRLLQQAYNEEMLMMELEAAPKSNQENSTQGQAIAARGSAHAHTRQEAPGNSTPPSDRERESRRREELGDTGSGQVASPASSARCGLCTGEEGWQVKLRCRECGEAVCQACVTMHRRVQSFANHTLEPLLAGPCV